MGCFSGPSTKAVSQPTLTKAQQGLVEQLAGQAGPAIAGVTGATIPGQEFAPGGPSALQQQAFGLPGFDQAQQAFQGSFDPAAIAQNFQGTADFARQGFREQTIPSILGALGQQGAARSSGAVDLLGRAGRNLELGLASQLGQQQQAGLQRAFQAPGQALGFAQQIAGLGQQQQAFPEAQRQFDLSNFFAAAPEQDPRLGFIGPAFTSAFDTVNQQQSGGVGAQLAGPAATLGAAKIAVLCVSEDTVIDTIDGSKPIQEIRAGDKVFDKDNKVVKVLWKYEYDEPPTSDRFIELTFNDTKLTVCDMHKIDGVRSKDLKVGDKGLVSKKFIEMDSRSYDLMTDGRDGSYRSHGIGIDSMIPELFEVVRNIRKVN
jgi:hypothetical protein